MHFIVILNLILAVLANDYLVRRTLTCTSFIKGKCAQWRSEGELIRIKPKCFPASTRVMSKQGTKLMSSLKIGEEILGYNFETRKSQFTRIIAWLHRIPSKTYKYLKVSTEHLQFISSSKHLIAVNNHSKIQYVFAENLLHKTLVSPSLQTEGLKVQKVQLTESVGVYAPYTALGNYFVEGSSRGKSLKKSDSVLILVHSFAHIIHPQKYHWALKMSIQIGSLFGINRQPAQNEEYIHPLSKIFKRAFPQLSVPEEEDDTRFFYDPRARKPHYSLFKSKQIMKDQLASIISLLCESPNIMT